MSKEHKKVKTNLIRSPNTNTWWFNTVWSVLHFVRDLTTCMFYKL